MSDLIRREDAIKALSEAFGECEPCDNEEAIDIAVTTVKEVPSADRPQEWIPCSEKLPSKSGEYLVTIIQNESSFQQGITNVFIRSLAPANILYGEGFGEQLVWRKELWEDVVAWMPLPKPWKGAEEDEQTEREGE